MENETKVLAPADAGLILAVMSDPKGEVQDLWPCIAFTVQLLNSRRGVIWEGPYRLGTGHVKWPSLALLDTFIFPVKHRLTPHEENVCRIHARGKNVQKTPEGMATEASTAAKLAKVQKVTPKLEDVCHSLLSDGAAFFDGLRFEDWAADLGYSSDSIKAKETFEACDRIGRELSRGLSRDELSGLREWAGNY
jgi:hypothetical protein